jgi:hypothetical protein
MVETLPLYTERSIIIHPRERVGVGSIPVNVWAESRLRNDCNLNSNEIEYRSQVWTRPLKEGYQNQNEIR